MPDTETTSLLAYRTSSEFLVVLALYKQLHDAFRQEFGPDAAPEYAVDDIGEHVPNLVQLGLDPGMLLPTHNGWCFSPEWIAPIRLDEKRLNPFPDLENTDTTALFLMEAISANSSQVVELPVIEQRIYERAWMLGLLRSADDLLNSAIEQARTDVAEASREYESRLDAAAGEATATSGDLKARLLSMHASGRGLRLFRLRLHWLELWNGIETVRKRKVRGRKSTQVTQVQAAIKPQDVFDAYGTIDMHLRRRDKTVNDPLAEYMRMRSQERLPTLLSEEAARIKAAPETRTEEQRAARLFEMLGLWYANMLYKCGASEEELQEMLISSHRSGQKTQPRNWHQIVRKMLNNHLQNDAKRYLNSP